MIARSVSFDGTKLSSLGWMMSSKSIESPEVRTATIDVPYRDGTIDITEYLTGTVAYKDRTITINVWKNAGSKDKIQQEYTDFANAYLGKRVKIVFDDDSSYYYVGRLSFKSWSTTQGVGALSIEATCEPYKYREVESDDWDWDPFLFDTDIVPTLIHGIKVDGEATLTFYVGANGDHPVITSDSVMTLEYDGVEYTQPAGIRKYYEFRLNKGIKNTLKFTGNGTISVDYVIGEL